MQMRDDNNLIMVNGVQYTAEEEDRASLILWTCVYVLTGASVLSIDEGQRLQNLIDTHYVCDAVHMAVLCFQELTYATAYGLYSKKLDTLETLEKLIGRQPTTI